jgi:hypothetical protein
MSHVGVAVCPHCQARYGVSPDGVGQTLPCPGCNKTFVVRLEASAPAVARPTPQATPPQPRVADDLFAAMPVPATTRVLGPAIVPKRRWLPEDVPWAGIAIFIGICVAVIGLAIGGYYASTAIGDAIASARPAAGKGSATTNATPASATSATPAAAVAAPLQALKSAADSAANAARNVAQLPASVLPDTHASCLAERDKLTAELRQVAAGLQDPARQKQVTQQCAEIIIKLQDLAIRWHLLPPMTEGERNEFNQRALADFERIRRGERPEPLKFDFQNDAALAVLLELQPVQVVLADALTFAHKPPAPPANVADESYVQVSDACRQMCRELYAVRTLADCERIKPALAAQAALVVAAGDKLKQARDLPPTAVRDSRDEHFLKFTHDEKMIAFTAKFAAARAAIEAAGGLNPEAKLAPDVQQRLKETAAALQSLRDDCNAAVSSFAAATRDLEQSAKSNLAEAARNSPSSRLQSVAGRSDPPLSESERVAIDQAIRKIENRPGIQTVLFHIRGGTVQERQSTERDVTQLASAMRWIAVDTSDGVVIAIDYLGDLQIFQSAIISSRPEKIDNDTRAIGIRLKALFVAGTPGTRQGRGLEFEDRVAGTSPATLPAGASGSFNDRVTASMQQFQREFGTDKVVVVTAPKSTEAQRKALENELQTLCEPERRAGHYGPEVSVIILPFAGDVQELAGKLRSVNVTGIDAAKRGIVVAWK